MFKSASSSSHNIGAVHAIYQKGDTLTQFAHRATEMKIFKFKNCKNSIKMAKKSKIQKLGVLPRNYLTASSYNTHYQKHKEIFQFGKTRRKLKFSEKAN